MVCPLPLYHSLGFIGSLIVATVYGAKLVLPSEKFDAEATLVAIQEEKGTSVNGN